GRIDEPAAVVAHPVADDAHARRLAIDLDHGHVGAARIRDVRRLEEMRGLEPGRDTLAADAIAAADASWPSSTRCSGRARSAKNLPCCWISSSATPSACAARRTVLACSSRAASATALPPTTAARLANVPIP